jgi:hypothetical protein
MEITRRLIGASATFSPENRFIGVDVEGLIRRLLLFDKYILYSLRLQEFPILARHFGYDGLRELLSTRLIEIRCECLQYGQTAQTQFDGQPTFPLLTYRVDWLDAANRRDYIHNCLTNIHESPGLRKRQTIKLKESVVSRIVDLPREDQSKWSAAFQHDFLHDDKLVRKSIDMAIRSLHGVENVPFSLALHQESSDLYKAETDLAAVLNIKESEAHRVIERGLLGIAALNQKIGEMKAYNAISGFRDEELPLFNQKLDFLAHANSSETKEESFRRVIELADLPDFSSEDGSIDIKKFLEIRDSSEARQFRDWLCGVGDFSDKEIKDEIRGFRTKLGLKIGSKTGKALRFLTTTVSGIAGPHTAAVGVVSGLVDSFLVDKILPRSGIAAFVNELYPSIFETTE